MTASGHRSWKLCCSEEKKHERGETLEAAGRRERNPSHYFQITQPGSWLGIQQNETLTPYWNRTDEYQALLKIILSVFGRFNLFMLVSKAQC